ncbi:unnamed protein product [Ascophyllum nodosum]
MPPRLPTASEMGITTEINAVDTDIKEVEIEISQVKAALDGKGVYLGISDPDKLFMELQQLREKEKQLRDKEKQLREEKNFSGRTKSSSGMRCFALSSRQVSRWDGGVFQKLADFSEKLTKATLLADNVLRLPKDVFFLGHDSQGSELFVRECYVELEGIIFDRVRHGRRRVVVSGTPGTGKSVFALYLLYRLRLQSKTVILQSKENWYRFSDEDGVQVLSPPGAITTINYLKDEDAWFICDPKDKEFPYQRVCGVTVVTISPNPTRISGFWKELKPIQLFMAMWTLDELKQCRELIYPHVPEDDVEFAYEKVGGVARLAFDKELLTVHIGSLKQRTKEVRLEDLQMAVDGCNSPSILSTKAVGDKFFSIHPRDGYEVFDVFWASSDAQDLAMATLKEKNVNMAEALILSNKLTGAENGL